MKSQAGLFALVTCALASCSNASPSDGAGAQEGTTGGTSATLTSGSSSTTEGEASSTASTTTATFGTETSTGSDDPDEPPPEACELIQDLAYPFSFCSPPVIAAFGNRVGVVHQSVEGELLLIVDIDGDPIAQGFPQSERVVEHASIGAGPEGFIAAFAYDDQTTDLHILDEDGTAVATRTLSGNPKLYDIDSIEFVSTDAGYLGVYGGATSSLLRSFVIDANADIVAGPTDLDAECCSSELVRDGGRFYIGVGGFPFAVQELAADGTQVGDARPVIDELFESPVEAWIDGDLFVAAPSGQLVRVDLESDSVVAELDFADAGLFGSLRTAAPLPGGVLLVRQNESLAAEILDRNLQHTGASVVLGPGDDIAISRSVSIGNRVFIASCFDIDAFHLFVLDCT